MPMSSSIAIPQRKHSLRSHATSSLSQPGNTNGYRSPSASSSYASSVSTSSAAASPTEPSSKKLGKSRAVDTPTRNLELAGRRPSLMGSSLAKSEYTVINLNSDGPPRLVTCVKSSQGFDWNQELFLPSYMEFDSTDLELRADPVHEITLTDEEAASMLP